MKKVGLWIDHKKAVIVFLKDKEEKIKLLNSNIEKYIHPSNGQMLGNPNGRRDKPADDILERDLKRHLNIYYDEIISNICNSENILIFGPGEAKNELKKRIEKNKLAGQILEIQPADKMTDRQIAAKVHKYFLI